MPDEKHHDREGQQADGVAGAEAVGEALRRGLAGLSIADETDDTGMGTFRWRPQHFSKQRAVSVERAAEHGIAGLLFHRHGFPRQRRFIRRGLTTEYPCIDRKLVVGQDPDGLTRHQAIGMHLTFAAIGGHQRGCLGRIVEKTANFPLRACQRQALKRITQRK